MSTKRGKDRDEALWRQVEALFDIRSLIKTKKHKKIELAAASTGATRRMRERKHLFAPRPVSW